ncbi:MAG: hypothetical protein ACJ77K_05340 [Bacteroidia bacterium]
MSAEKNIKNTLKAILLAAAVLLAGSAFAQEVKATATLDSNSIEIGQQVRMKLSIQYRVDNGKRVTVSWPEIADTLRKEVEVVSQSKTDTVSDKNDPFLFTQSRTLVLTSFDSGYWAIPPFRFSAGDTNGIYTDPVLLQVSPVPVDTTLAIKDIKGIYGETYSFMDWLKDNMYVVYGGIVVIAALLIIWLIFRYTRKVKPPMVIIEPPKIPAHVIAFEKLEKLKEEKLWQEGKLKQYYSSLTDVLREYIENRFKIPAMEQTTDEILFGFRNVAIDEESRMKLKNTLLLADLVKFAKEHPLPAENELSMAHSYDFINGTKREEQPVENKTTGNK